MKTLSTYMTLLACLGVSTSLLASGEYEKYAYIYKNNGDLITPRNHAAECPDPDGLSNVGNRCHGVAVAADGRYSLEIDNHELGNGKNHVVVVKEFRLEGATKVPTHTKRRIDDVTVGAINNGLDVNRRSESCVQAVEKDYQVTLGTSNGGTPAASHLDSLDADALNYAFNNSKNDNRVHGNRDDLVYGIIENSIEGGDVALDNALYEIATTALLSQADPLATEYVRKGLQQAVIADEDLDVVAGELATTVSKIKTAGNDVPVIVLEADRYLVETGQNVAIHTSNSINASMLQGWEWTGVTATGRTANFFQTTPGIYEICVTGTIGQSANTSTDCVSITVIDAVHATASASVYDVFVGDTVRLSAEDSVGGTTYAWSGSGVFSSPGTVVTDWVAPATPGSYTLTVSVNGTHTDTLDIRVKAMTPIAHLNVGNYTIRLGTDSPVVNLSSLSTNPDGSSVDSVNWVLTETPASSLATLSTSTANVSAFTVDEPGEYRVTLTADTGGNTHSASATITVIDAAAPVALGNVNLIGHVGEPIPLDASNSYDPANSPLSYAWSATGGNITNGSSTVAEFEASALGDFLVTLTVSNSLKDAVVTFPVSIRNRAPVSTTSAHTVAEDGTYSGALIGIDGDGQVLTYAVALAPQHGTVVITDAAQGLFDYTPDPDFNGVDTFTFTLSDGSVTSNVSTVTVTTFAVADAPMLLTSEFSTNENELLSDTLVASDGDGDSVTYAIAQAPSIGSVTITDSSAGTFTYTPDTNANGADSFSVTVTDSTGLSTTTVVNVTVLSVN